MGIGERLRSAIEAWRDGSIRDFQREMARSGARGSSYATIHSYLADRTRPSEEFLRAAAELLGVRFEWLRDGAGAPAEREQEILTAAISGLTGEWKIDPGRFAEVMRKILGPTTMTPAALAAYFEGLHRYLGQAPVSETFSGAQMELFAHHLWRLVTHPLEAWGFRKDLDGREWTDYVTAMMHALMLAMPARGHGDSLNVFEEEETDGEDA